MDGFQAMGDHLPVPVIMDPVPEAALPEMVDYTPEVAAARAEFLRAQEAIMAEHAAMEAEDMGETSLRREVEQLQLAMLKLETNKPGRRANTSFGTFASRDFAKVLNNKDFKICGQFDLGGKKSFALDETATPLVVNTQSLKDIHMNILA